MALLWRAEGADEPKPGPKPGLSVGAIIAAAIAVADANGMAALSMRAVGERLGCTAMALYTYVPSKSELVDLMYDAALAEARGEYDLGAGWRPALTAWARDLWAFYVRHPWVLQVSQARPVLGPNEYQVLDAVLRIMFETGLPPQIVRRITAALFQLTRGAAQTVAEAREAATATGTTDEEWWYRRSALLTEVAPDFGSRFPMVTRLAEAGGYAMSDETKPYLEQESIEMFHTGLAVLLDGVEVAMGEPGGEYLRL
jgi:AcrR family transcriptional regulator